MNQELIKLKSSVRESNIQETTQKVIELETRLKLSEIALENARVALQEKEEFVSSKEYKEALKEQEAIKKENLERARAFHKNLLQLQEEAKVILEKNQEFDRLSRKTKSSVPGFSISMKKPYNWLSKVSSNLESGIEQAKGLRFE